MSNSSMHIHIYKKSNQKSTKGFACFLRILFLAVLSQFSFEGANLATNPKGQKLRKKVRLQ